MRKSNATTLGQAIRAYLKALGLDNKLKERSLINSWEETLGKNVANATSNIYIYDQKLFVELNSSIIRNELFMMKSAIMDSLNKKAGEIIIKDIILK
ncbi:MAG: DUF721 domain-containing protein [Bacteroidales bacterium]|nr:DUF721 domain-containing protein [Bacteroidales bacterium]MBN2756656.1 DUF721 domain-containing protein [Bacteroidales bacterium]